MIERAFHGRRHGCRRLAAFGRLQSKHRAGVLRQKDRPGLRIDARGRRAAMTSATRFHPVNPCAGQD